MANFALRFAALCLFAPCTRLQVTKNVNGANSTKPLLYAVCFNFLCGGN